MQKGRTSTKVVRPLIEQLSRSIICATLRSLIPYVGVSIFCASVLDVVSPQYDPEILNGGFVWLFRSTSLLARMILFSISGCLLFAARLMYIQNIHRSSPGVFACYRWWRIAAHFILVAIAIEVFIINVSSVATHVDVRFCCIASFILTIRYVSKQIGTLQLPGWAGTLPVISFFQSSQPISSSIQQYSLQSNVPSTSRVSASTAGRSTPWTKTPRTGLQHKITSSEMFDTVDGSNEQRNHEMKKSNISVGFFSRVLALMFRYGPINEWVVGESHVSQSNENTLWVKSTLTHLMSNFRVTLQLTFLIGVLVIFDLGFEAISSSSLLHLAFLPFVTNYDPLAEADSSWTIVFFTLVRNFVRIISVFITAFFVEHHAIVVRLSCLLTVPKLLVDPLYAVSKLLPPPSSSLTLPLTPNAEHCSHDEFVRTLIASHIASQAVAAWPTSWRAATSRTNLFNESHALLVPQKISSVNNPATNRALQFAAPTLTMADNTSMVAPPPLIVSKKSDIPATSSSAANVSRFDANSHVRARFRGTNQIVMLKSGSAAIAPRSTANSLGNSVSLLWFLKSIMSWLSSGVASLFSVVRPSSSTAIKSASPSEESLRSMIWLRTLLQLHNAPPPTSPIEVSSTSSSLPADLDKNSVSSTSFAGIDGWGCMTVALIMHLRRTSFLLPSLSIPTAPNDKNKNILPPLAATTGGTTKASTPSFLSNLITGINIFFRSSTNPPFLMKRAVSLADRIVLAILVAVEGAEVISRIHMHDELLAVSRTTGLLARAFSSWASITAAALPSGGMTFLNPAAPNTLKVGLSVLAPGDATADTAETWLEATGSLTIPYPIYAAGMSSRLSAKVNLTAIVEELCAARNMLRNQLQSLVETANQGGVRAPSGSLVGRLACFLDKRAFKSDAPSKLLVASLFATLQEIEFAIAMVGVYNNPCAVHASLRRVASPFAIRTLEDIWTECGINFSDPPIYSSCNRDVAANSLSQSKAGGPASSAAVSVRGDVAVAQQVKSTSVRQTPPVGLLNVAGNGLSLTQPTPAINSLNDIGNRTIGNGVPTAADSGMAIDFNTPPKSISLGTSINIPGNSVFGVASNFTRGGTQLSVQPSGFSTACGAGKSQRIEEAKIRGPVFPKSPFKLLVEERRENITPYVNKGGRLGMTPVNEVRTAGIAFPVTPAHPTKLF